MMAIEGSALERGKPDPDVVLPAAVRRASERANELAQQAKEAKAANPDADKPLRIITSAPTINSSGVQVTDFDPNNPAPPPEPAPPSNSPSSASVEGQSQPQPAPDVEHQFKSLQGRYSKADEENRRMAQQVADLQRLLATVQTPPRQEGSGVRFSGPVAQPRVTPKEVEEFGKEFIDVVGRRAMEVQEATLQPKLSQLELKIQQLEGQLGGVRQVQATDANERMWNILDKEVPNWQGINNSPEFVQWLQVPDPLSGQIRHGLLDEAFKNQQVGRVIEFFRRFLGDYAQAAPQSQPRPAIDVRGSGVGNVDLMTLAAPGRAKTGQTNLAPEKPTYTTAEISQFYHDKTHGRYKGREAEMNAIENDIFTAQREGRIRKP